MKYDEKLVQVSGPPPEPTPILSAKEIALKDVNVNTKPDPHPTTTKLLKQIASDPTHVDLDANGVQAAFADYKKYFQTIVNLGCGAEGSSIMEAPLYEEHPLRPWPDPDAKARLLEIETEIKDGHDYSAEHFSIAAAEKKFLGQGYNYDQAAHTGTLNDAPAMRSRSDIQQECNAKAAAMRKVWEKRTAEETTPICRAAFKRLCEIILPNALMYLEVIGRDEATAFGLNWTPSMLWRAAAFTLIKFALKKDPAPGIYVLPSHHLDGLLEVD